MNDNDMRANMIHAERRAADFDAAVRASSQEAGENLSVRTFTQLRLRQRAALQPRHAPVPSMLQRFAWPVAASLAAVLAVVVGMQVQPVPGAADTPAAIASTVNDADTVLDEDPDMFVWLASVDATSLAME